MKTQYTAPELTVVSVRTERGYASTGATEGVTSRRRMDLLMSSQSSGSSVEGRTMSDHWTASDANGFWEHEF